MKNSVLTIGISLLLSGIASGQWVDPGNDGTGTIHYENGSVGIHTTNPYSPLEVAGTTSSSNGYIMSINEDRGSSYNGGFASKSLRFSFGDQTMAGMGMAGSASSGVATPDYFFINVGPTNNNDYSAPQMVVRSNGNVGIGTTLPSSTFTVAGTIESTGGGIKFPDGTVQSTAASGLWNGTGTTVSYDGKVGIGISNPAVTLHVNGGETRLERSYLHIYNTSADSTDSYMRFHIGQMAWYSMGIDHSDAGKFKINYGSGIDGEHFVMAPNGLVGIGTNAPARKLHVDGSGICITGAASIVQFDESDNNKQWYAVVDGNSFDFRENTTSNVNTRFRIVPGGNVGIGTNAPASKLSVAGTIESTTGGIKFPDGTVQTTAATGTGGTSIWAQSGAVISYDGNVGIGTTAPQYDLDIVGTVRTCEVKVSNLEGWCDYVFEEDYELPALEAVEAYIKANKHLMDIPSEAEVMEHGISLGSMDAALLKKVEELTLYVIELKKENQSLKEANNTAIKALLQRMEKLEASN